MLYSWMVEMRNTFKVMVRTPEGNRPFGRPRLRLENNTGRDLRETRRECVDWMHLAQDRD